MFCIFNELLKTNRNDRECELPTLVYHLVAKKLFFFPPQHISLFSYRGVRKQIMLLTLSESLSVYTYV